MIKVRKNAERGSAHFSWLDALYTFSFSEYYDPKYLGFRSLKVINEDRVKPASGFPMHGHRNMEIMTYIISGVLSHKDTLGNGSIIQAGEVQLMSAGKEIRHSEYNHSQDQLLHLLQIWIEPHTINTEPAYQQKNISEIEDKFLLLVSPTGERNSLVIKQDIKIYRAVLQKNESFSYKLPKLRHAWIQIIFGSILLSEEIQLKQGDGAAITEGDLLTFLGTEDINHFLLFDLV